jgi:hypothetical protein
MEPTKKGNKVKRFLGAAVRWAAKALINAGREEIEKIVTEKGGGAPGQAPSPSPLPGPSDYGRPRRPVPRPRR